MFDHAEGTWFSFSLGGILVVEGTRVGMLGKKHVY